MLTWNNVPGRLWFRVSRAGPICGHNTGRSLIGERHRDGRRLWLARCRLGAAAVLLHRHRQRVMRLHAESPLGIFMGSVNKSGHRPSVPDPGKNFRLAMDVSPPPASDDLVYAYKPSLLGVPFEFRLTATALEWSRGRHAIHIPYGQIRRLRLSFRPVSMQSHRFLAEVWATGGPKLKIFSTSWRSVVEQERHDAAYRAFIDALHRRIAAAGITPVLQAGAPAALYWIGVAVFAATALALAALSVRALQVDAYMAATIVGGFLGLFLWQVGTFFRRNRPGTYRADALPPQVLP